MKKLLFIMLLALVACEKEQSKSIEIQISSYELVANEYFYSRDTISIKIKTDQITIDTVVIAEVYEMTIPESNSIKIKADCNKWVAIQVRGEKKITAYKTNELIIQ